MKRFLLITTLVLNSVLMPMSVYSQYNDAAFEMPTSNSIILNLNTAIENSKSIELNIEEPIYGLAVSGTCKLKTKNAFVRILLRDDCNYEHLVYENYELLADSSDNNFVNIGIETTLLDSIIPMELRIFLTDAELYLSNISYTTTEHNSTLLQIQSIRNVQNNAIANKLNEHLSERGMTWRAGTTFVSSLSYEEKKTLFGSDTLPNLYGIEYYKGGIYVMPDYDYSNKEYSDSKFVDSFDWRDRHGKNWLTSVKSQGKCGSCWAYSAIDLTEAYVNLYYNQLLNYDLSEQEIISCSYEHPTLFYMNNGGCKGGHTSGALRYIQYKGVTLEDCLPYGDFYYDEKYKIAKNIHTLVDYRERCETPSEIVKIEQYNELYNSYLLDDIKSYLFNQPLAFTVYFKYSDKEPLGGHCMLMTGYKTIHAGDSICKEYLSDNIIQAPEEMDGTTAFIVKNCWGEDWGDSGYGYLVTRVSNLEEIFQIAGKITSKVYSTKDILCKDEDGDGYYTWGIGTHITEFHLPNYVPKQQDGDDSNAKYGPMNFYGQLQDLNPDKKDTIFITEPTNWNKDNYIWQHVLIKDGGLLNITSNIKFYKGVKLCIANGGKLVVDGGKLENTNIYAESKGQLCVKNGGIIKKYKQFFINNGAIIKIENGTIH